MASINVSFPPENSGAHLSELQEQFTADILERFLEVELSRKKGKAVFRVPTVSQLKQVAASPSAVRENMALSTKAVIELARLTCVNWGGEDGQMPDNNHIGSKDYTAVVRRFNLLLGEEIPREYQTLKNDGGVIEVGDEVEVTLEGEDRVVLRELTADEMLKVEQVQGGVEQNIRMMMASCVLWNGEKIKWVDVMSNLNKMPINNFYRLTQTFSEFFLS